MGSLFNGLESMGFKGLDNVKLYEEEKKKTADPTKEAEKETVVVTEADFLFDKKFVCPVCGKEFKAKIVKTGKPRLIGSDSDLRPKYSGIDSVKYDAVICSVCGYGALTRFFTNVSDSQIKLIRDNISAAFTGLPKYGEFYSYDEAINRYKLALFNAIVKKGKNSERAYTCLKLAWLFRGYRENPTPEKANDKEFVKECEKNELEMLNNALEGFLISRSKEDMPICGMDEATFDYLLADLAFRLGKYDLASQMTSNVIVSRGANPKVKEKARNLRELIKDKISH